MNKILSKLCFSLICFSISFTATAASLNASYNEGNVNLSASLNFDDVENATYSALAKAEYASGPETITSAVNSYASCYAPEGQNGCVVGMQASAGGSYSYFVEITPIAEKMTPEVLSLSSVGLYFDYFLRVSGSSASRSYARAQFVVDTRIREIRTSADNQTVIMEDTEVFNISPVNGVRIPVSLSAYSTATARGAETLDWYTGEITAKESQSQWANAIADPTVYVDPLYAEYFNVDIQSIEGPFDATIGVSAVPIPAGAWLFGTALLGLGLVKRRGV